MPADDAEFAAYLDARWPTAVRVLVLLGCSRAEALGVAAEGFARCREDWARLRHEGDVDTALFAALLAAPGERRRRRDRRPEGAGVPPAESARPGDDDPAAALLGALQAQLAALPDTDREALLLRHLAGLDEEQAGEVLDVPAAEVRRRDAAARAALDLQALGELAP